MLRALLLTVLGCLGVAPAPEATTAPPAGPPAAPPFALPGATPPPEALVGKLSEAWEARPEGYAPRTRHLEADGSPTYINRLFLETSPYLRQHAHNPVDWYPWGDEAFAAAAARGVPVLLSVGYSTCHWCHVMEEESFEDPEIAAFLNTHYVAIKVDREERPDVDAVYMSAVQMLTGRGGWPMTVWLTPDRQPFYGGTYFPARDGDRGERRGFLTALGRMSEAWGDERELIVADSARTVAALSARLTPLHTGEPLPGVAALDAAVAEAAAELDPTWGGARGAPRFPSSFPTRALLRAWRRTGEAAPLEMAALTLEKMATGGLYDHVGGGFHRYSTDERWLVPHFEKMLYDNAQLAVAYTEAWRATGREDFARVAREILRYVARDMTSPEGAFYSATDADSLTPGGHREEGWFFTWTPEELDAVLGEDAAAAAAWYQVAPGGNFEGRSILHTPRTAASVAADLAMSPEDLLETVAAARESLYAARLERPAPLRDEKVLAGWNGLMISACARAALAFDAPDYSAAASRAAGFVLEELVVDGRLRRSWKDGQARHHGVLEDHAFLAAGLLDLFEATGERRWLEGCLAMDALLEAHFEDREAGGWYRTADDAEALLAREKPWQDRAVPSGGSVHALTLLRLYALTGKEGYRRRAEAAIGAMGGVLERAPGALSELLLAVDWLSGRPREVVIVTPGGREEAAPFLKALAGRFEPNVVLVVVSAEEVEALAEVVPPVAGKVAGDTVTAYVCEQGVCQLPATDPETFLEQLAR
jgi:uncharacterized protein YyaL (SSP411 family)